MSKKIESKFVDRSKTSIAAVCDFLCTKGTRMVTVDFITKKGVYRTINGMVLRTADHLASVGKFKIKENIIAQNSLGQCHTVKTQFRMINLATVSRLAFNKTVYEFV